jgi:hypothetical protein
VTTFKKYRMLLAFGLFAAGSYCFAKALEEHYKTMPPQIIDLMDSQLIPTDYIEEYLNRVFDMNKINTN